MLFLSNVDASLFSIICLTNVYSLPIRSIKPLVLHLSVSKVSAALDLSRPCTYSFSIVSASILLKAAWLYLRLVIVPIEIVKPFLLIGHLIWVNVELLRIEFLEG